MKNWWKVTDVVGNGTMRSKKECIKEGRKGKGDTACGWDQHSDVGDLQISELLEVYRRSI